MIVPYEAKDTCYICELFNHSLEDVYWEPVCVKCGQIHREKDCTVTDTSVLKCEYCINKHTANFKGWPDDPKNFKNKTRERWVKRTKNTFLHKRVDSNVSFADKVKSNAKHIVNSAKNLM